MNIVKTQIGMLKRIAKDKDVSKWDVETLRAYRDEEEEMTVIFNGYHAVYLKDRDLLINIDQMRLANTQPIDIQIAPDDENLGDVLERGTYSKYSILGGCVDDSTRAKKKMCEIFTRPNGEKCIAPKKYTDIFEDDIAVVKSSCGGIVFFDKDTHEFRGLVMALRVGRGNIWM